MGLRFLVVEDNPKNMRLMRMVLRAGGHDMIEATDGQEAIDKALAEKYDAILMDIQLPVMSGLEVAQLLLTKPEMAQVPMIALTAHAMKGDRENFLNAGFRGYIAKPIDTRTFVQEVESILSSTGQASVGPKE